MGSGCREFQWQPWSPGGKTVSRVVRGTGRLAKGLVGEHILRMSKGLRSTPSITQTHAHTRAHQDCPPCTVAVSSHSGKVITS